MELQQQPVEIGEILNHIIRDVLTIILEEIKEEISEQNRPKRLWERKWIARRNNSGASEILFKELAAEDTYEYFKALRMSEESFNYLLGKVQPMIQKADTNMRSSLPAKLKLHIVLYLLATGNSTRSLMHFFRVSKASICGMVTEVCEAIYTALKDFIKVPSQHAEWKEIETGFRTRWNFPGCCGAIDGKHVVVKAPPEGGSFYYNYKHTNSIVLLAVVDHDYCFKYINVGCNGRVSDGGVFRNSTLNAALEDKMLPDKHVLVADNAFPLKSYLMKPYPGQNLTLKQKVFNYRLSRARRIVENAFGILVARFRIFEKPLPYNPKKIDKMVKASCALHNWLRMTKSNVNTPTVDVEDIDEGHILPGNWREVTSQGLIPVRRNLQNHSTQEAQAVRDNYAEYFVGEGSVRWQTRMIY